MSSRIKHVVEPAMGWSFVLVLLLVLAGALLSATRPIERTGPMQFEQVP